MTRVPTGDWGLDLVLGGGLPLLARQGEAEPSTSILLRGGPGAGKTILAMQLALAVARHMRSDVAYACVELLPRELQAQHEGLLGAQGKGIVQVPPWTRGAANSPSPSRVFAAVLDTGAAEMPVDDSSSLEDLRSPERLGAGLDDLLSKATEAAGRKPRVLVVDSLSDGYGLGSSAPRLLADQLVKFAADEGLVLVLLEEMAREVASPWSFATDLVLVLSYPEVGAHERRIAVVKSRLGRAAEGIHRSAILQGVGMRVFPNLAAYDFGEPAVEDELPVVWGVRPPQPWNLPVAKQPDDLPDFRDCLTVVFGPDTGRVLSLARRLGTQGADGTDYPGSDIWVIPGGGRLEAVTDRPIDEVIPVSPVLTPERLAAAVTVEVLRAAKSSTERNLGLRRILAGDVSAFGTSNEAGDLARALVVAAGTVRRRALRTAIILYQTAPPVRSAREPGYVYMPQARGPMPTHHPDFEPVGVPPQVAAWADMVVDLSWKAGQQQGWHVHVTDQRTGRSWGPLAILPETRS
ncbi:MAG: hypothetical protein HY905_27530 [Deltaproteobacteria bacterium]|nr:hypothetical protein [Deltaproteobacteria bacterium]